MAFRFARIPHYVRHINLYYRSFTRNTFTNAVDFLFAGKSLGKTIPSRYSAYGAFPTQNTQYRILKEIFTISQLKNNDVVMDVGCGEGRVLIYLVLRRFKGDIRGVELDPQIAQETAWRLRHTRAKVFPGNVLDVMDNAITVYYLFNPFNQNTLERFIAKAEQIHQQTSVVYYFPLFKDCFLNRPGWTCTEYSLQTTANKLVIARYANPGPVV